MVRVVRIYNNMMSYHLMSTKACESNPSNAAAEVTGSLQA
jgi:hypothetical protein